MYFEMAFAKLNVCSPINQAIRKHLAEDSSYINLRFMYFEIAFAKLNAHKQHVSTTRKAQVKLIKIKLIKLNQFMQ
jgi:hypothetical protein